MAVAAEAEAGAAVWEAEALLGTVEGETVLVVREREEAEATVPVMSAAVEEPAVLQEECLAGTTVEEDSEAHKEVEEGKETEGVEEMEAGEVVARQ